MKIYFPHTSTRIAQLHALGLVLHPEYELVPLVGLRKQHRPTPGEQPLFTVENAPARVPEWHQLVPLAGLDTGKQNNPADLWEKLQQARQQTKQAYRQAA